MSNISNTIALAAASIFLAAIVGYVIWRGLAAVRRVGTFFLLFTVGMAFYGGSKGFWRSVNFPRTDLDIAYLTDNDSRVWSTNFVHLAFTPASMVPQDAQIYLDYRAAASTNDEDWVTYTNATLAAFPNPLDFEFENATNYSWMCYTTWTPGAAEVTNGVVRIGWLLPMDGATNTIVMLRTGVRYKSPLPYDAEVEYLESTGTQWIDVPFSYGSDTGFFFDYMPTVYLPSSGFFGSGLVNGVAAYDLKGLIVGSGSQRFDRYDRSCRYFTLYQSQRQNMTFNPKGAVSGSAPYRYQHSLAGRLRQDDSWWDRSYSAPNGTIGVFHVYNRADIGNGVLRIYCLEFREYSSATDYTVTMKLTPVRVGTEGCLYDRVSGQVFHNGGTGAFLYGADKTN